jgi:hypothetical protein
MATIIKIGHASISENNTAYGQAGDSTGKEVCINNNFNITDLAPTVLLRPKSSTLAEASALACEAGCTNNNIGYSQNGRNTLYSYASKVNYDLTKVTTKCNTDCSAFMTVCAIAGGANISYGTNAPTTTNMCTRFKQSGNYTILTDSKHLTKTDYLKRGDILVKEGSHTVMVLENGNQHTDDSSDLEDPGSSTGITQTRKIRTYAIDVDIADIKMTSATIKFKVVESINNVDKILTNTSKWVYSLSVTSLLNGKTKEYKFSSDKMTLADLTAGSSYMFVINAKTANGALAFCSASRVLTTAKKHTSSDEPTIEFIDEAVNKTATLIDKVFINNNDKFDQAIIYKNT